MESFADSGKELNSDAFSVWKPVPAPGLFPIGDIFVASEAQPGSAILARAVDPNADMFRQSVLS